MRERSARRLELAVLTVSTVAVGLCIAAGVILLGYQCFERLEGCAWIAFPLGKVTGLSADGMQPGALRTFLALVLDLPTAGTLMFGPYLLLVGVVYLYDRATFRGE